MSVFNALLRMFVALFVFVSITDKASASVCFLPNPSLCGDSDGDDTYTPDPLFPNRCDAGYSYSYSKKECIRDCDLSDVVAGGVITAKYYSKVCPSGEGWEKRGECEDAHDKYVLCGCKDGYDYADGKCWPRCSDKGYTYNNNDLASEKGWQCDSTPCVDATGNHYKCSCKTGYRQSGNTCEVIRECASGSFYANDPGGDYSCSQKTDIEGGKYFCCDKCVKDGDRNCEGFAEIPTGMKCSGTCKTCTEGHTRYTGCNCDADAGYEDDGNKCCYNKGLCTSNIFQKPASAASTYTETDLGCGKTCYTCATGHTYKDADKKCYKDCSTDYAYSTDKSTQTGWECSGSCVDATGEHWNCKCKDGYELVNGQCQVELKCNAGGTATRTKLGNAYSCESKKDVENNEYFCCYQCVTGGSSSCATGKFTGSVSAGWTCSSNCKDCVGDIQYSNCSCRTSDGYISYNGDCCKPNSCSTGITTQPTSASTTYSVKSSLGCGVKCYQCNTGYYYEGTSCKSCYDKYNNLNSSSKSIKVNSVPTGCVNYQTATCGGNTYYYNITDMDTSCSNGSEWNSDLCRCVTCDISGYEDKIPSGCYNCTSTSICGKTVYDCSEMSGYKRPKQTGTCYSYDEQTAADGAKCWRSTPPNTSCASGYTYDTTQCKCVTCASYIGNGATTDEPGQCYTYSTTTCSGDDYYYNLTDHTPSCGSNTYVSGSGDSCECECNAGFCKNSAGNCVKPESLSCPSNTTSSCYKSVTTTEKSGNCSKSCTYTVANNPTCGANAHITYGSNGSCGCACDTNYTGDGYTCRRLQCSDGGYYTSSQNTNCDSSGYKKTGSQKVTYAGLECWTAGTSTACACSDGNYESSCSAGCSGNSVVSCTPKTYGGKTCYIKSTTACGSNQTCSNGQCGMCELTYSGSKNITLSCDAQEVYIGDKISTNDYCEEMALMCDSLGTTPKYRFTANYSGNAWLDGNECTGKISVTKNTGSGSRSGTIRIEDKSGTSYEVIDVTQGDCVCVPSWPSYQAYDYNNCMTSSDGTVSDGCGNTATKYKSACTGNQTCNGSGQCVSKCNTANNQYADEQECDEDWHQWWKCYKNNSSGCWYPTCNEDDDYYTDQQTCEIETGKNCEVESATANYIVCYTPIKCDNSKNQYTYQQCMALQPEDGCVKDNSTGCYKPLCDPGSYYYEDEQDCEHYTYSECMFDDHFYCYTPNCSAEGGYYTKNSCGSNCTQDPNSGCWFAPICNENNYKYGDKQRCEYWSEMSCKLVNGCYVADCSTNDEYDDKSSCDENYMDCKQDSHNGCWYGYRVCRCDCGTYVLYENGDAYVTDTYVYPKGSSVPVNCHNEYGSADGNYWKSECTISDNNGQCVCPGWYQDRQTSTSCSATVGVGGKISGYSYYN